MTDKNRAQTILELPNGHVLMLILTLDDTPDVGKRMRAFCDDDGVIDLVRSIGFRSPEAKLTCVLGFSDSAWRRIFKYPAPKHLHPFEPIKGERHEAPATPGDLVLHIRAQRRDLCFELASQALLMLKGVATPVLEVQGFRYFDSRDLLGFVDGSEDPTGLDEKNYILIGEDDPGHSGGSYLIVQKYLHDLESWNRLKVEEQEKIIGRNKLNNVQLPDDQTPSYAHRQLTSINAADGSPRKILRDNMPFGSPAEGEFGTLFIGYAGDPGVTEEMLRNMFIGKPPGNYDRILDFSTAVSGALFYTPALGLFPTLAADPGPG